MLIFVLKYISDNTLSRKLFHVHPPTNELLSFIYEKVTAIFVKPTACLVVLYISQFLVPCFLAHYDVPHVSNKYASTFFRNASLFYMSPLIRLKLSLKSLTGNNITHIRKSDNTFPTIFCQKYGLLLTIY